MNLEIISLLIAISIMVFFTVKIKKRVRLAYIENYVFPILLAKRVKAQYPHLTDQNIQTVLEGLRDFFVFCHQAKRKMVAMPSQVVDLAWHEFILSTKTYTAFSKKGLGRYLHHTPTEAMKSKTVANEGIKRAWKFACAKEGIERNMPKKLPRIFAMDALLKIEDGFIYTLDCKDKASPYYGDGYCASDIGCTSGCGGDSHSFFDGDSSGSDCGGGCGGD